MSIAPKVLPLLLMALAGGASAAERRFGVDGFDRIVNESSLDLSITTGGTTQVLGRGDDTLLQRLDLRVEGSTLRIRLRNGRGGDARLVVAVPVLAGLVLSSSGDARVERIETDGFSGTTTGSGNLDIGWLEAPSARLQATGSGGIVASGRVARLTAGTTGSGDLRLGGLDTVDLDVSSTGSGDIAARASGTARMRSTGSGDISVSGGARCVIRSSGSGDVRCGDGPPTSG